MDFHKIDRRESAPGSYDALHIAIAPLDQSCSFAYISLVSSTVEVYRRMEDLVSVNGVKDVNGGTDRLYYELDGEGDADSSTTLHNVDPHRDRKFPMDIISSTFNE
ncbi:hypothetical protein ANTPLA_LOCUS5510 [Anthophora plagiata]